MILILYVRCRTLNFYIVFLKTIKNILLEIYNQPYRFNSLIINNEFKLHQSTLAIIGHQQRSQRTQLILHPVLCLNQCLNVAEPIKQFHRFRKP